ncbi:unnamed protein product, partial [Brenthis ino]
MKTFENHQKDTWLYTNPISTKIAAACSFSKRDDGTERSSAVCWYSLHFAVQNRLGDLVELTQPEDWQWFPTSENVADISRTLASPLTTVRSEGQNSYEEQVKPIIRAAAN